MLQGNTVNFTVPGKDLSSAVPVVLWFSGPVVVWSSGPLAPWQTPGVITETESAVGDMVMPHEFIHS